jgi:ABC-type sugar transport system substrate-binding protein
MKNEKEAFSKYFKKINLKKPEVLIFEQIMDLIYVGKLKIGDQLPPVEALRDRFNVSDNHVQKAINKLAGLGLITKIPNGEIIVSNDTKRMKSHLPDKKNIVVVDFDKNAIGQKDYCIGFSQTTLDHPARRFMNERYLECAKSLGIRAITLDAKWSVDAEISNIVALIKRRVNGIIISTHAGNNIKPAVLEAKKAKIPVLIFSSGQPIGDWPFDIWASSNDWQLGRIAGYKAALEMGGKGRLIEVQGTLGSSITEGRTNGISSSLEDFPDATIVEKFSTNWNRNGTYDVIMRLLKKGLEVEIVIAHCDEQAIGALLAIKDVCKERNESRRTKVISVSDAQEDTFHFIRSNDIISTMHYEQNGEIALNLILQKIEGLQPPKLVNLGTYLIDKSNVEEYRPDY